MTRILQYSFHATPTRPGSYRGPPLKGTEMRDELISLPKGEILTLFATLRGAATCGFNHELLKKSECVDKLLAAYPEATIREAMAREGRAMSKEPAADSAAIGTQIASLISTLAGSQVNEAKVREIVAEAVKEAIDASPVTRIEVTRPDGSQHQVQGHVRPEFQAALRRAAAGINLLLVGPAGSGKTHFAHQIAEALGREFASISCTAGMSESALSGWLIPTGEGGRFEFVSSDFVRLYEGGGVFLFDEVDAADANTLLFINQALANGSFYLPQRAGSTKVSRHSEFVCIAAANTFGTGANGTYAGRERLDEAFLDRFRAGRLFMGYDTAFERKTVDPELLAWGWSVRARINELKMSRVMSTRFLLDSTKLIAAGESIEDVKAAFFLDWKADDRSKVEVA